MSAYLPVASVSVTYREASLGVREALALSADDVAAALHRWRAAGINGFIISTCQRTEIHVRDGASVSSAVREVFRGRDENAIAAALVGARVRVGADAVRHLLRVAAGLDSISVGESEVIGQVRRAVMRARNAYVLDPLTHRLGDVALLTGKRVRRETAIEWESASLITAALEEAARRLNGIAGRNIAVLGAGHMGRAVLRALTTAAPASVVVASRSLEHAITTGARANARVESWDHRHTALDRADLLVTCTSGGAPAITAEMMRTVLVRRTVTRRRWPVVVDLSVPRSVERDAQYDAHVIDLDWIASAYRTPNTWSSAVAAAHAIVEDETERFAGWWSRRTTLASNGGPCIAQRVAI